MTASGPVVLAISPDQDVPVLALRWAAQEARQRNVPLEIVCVYLGRRALQSAFADPDFDVCRREEADLAVRTALGMHELADVDARGSSVDGEPAGVLLQVSRSAAELVIGSRSLGSVGALVHGSLEAVIVAEAHCPIVVMRGRPGNPVEGATVVVGVDGTADAQQLLAFGFETASRHGVGLTAVLSWHPDLLASMQWRPEQPAPESARRWVAEALAGWRERYPDVVARGAAVRDHVADALTTHAGTPYLVVVGRHKPQLTHPLPSHDRAVLHRATCPVAVVPLPAQQGIHPMTAVPASREQAGS